MKIMAKYKIVFMNFLCWILCVIPSGKCITNEDQELIQILINKGNNGNGFKSLFYGSFGVITAFGCRDVSQKIDLLRGLSQTFLLSNFLEIEESLDLLKKLAWAKGHKNKELPNDAHKILFIMDLDCPRSEDFLLKANEEQMFSAPYKWLIITRTNDTGLSNNIFDNLNILPDSELAIWQRSKNYPNRILSIYKTSTESNNFEIEDRGHWSADSTELILKDTRVTARRRRNLKGAHLKSCLVITNPDSINHLTDYKDRHIDTVTKCNYPWSKFLTDMLNATVSFKTTNTWGYKGANGSWTGMSGFLQRGEIEFGGTSSFFTKERMEIVQYISLSTPSGSRFIFRKPPLSSVANLFKLPFRDSVWFGIIALIMLITAVLYPAMKMEWSQESDDKRENQPPNLSDNLLVVVGAVSQQGSWYEPRSAPTRLIIIMALLTFLMLYASYTANIVALLQSTTSTITTLQDLLDSPLTLAVHDTVFFRYYFQSFKDPIRKSIYEERVEPKGIHQKNNWLTLEDGVERLRQGYFAFHTVRGAAYQLIQETYEEDEKCGFSEIDYLNVVNPHYIVKKRSPYLELLRIGSMRLHETGMRTRESNLLYTAKPICASSGRFVSVGLTECYGAFLTLLIGIFITIMILLAEFIFKYRNRKLFGKNSLVLDENISRKESIHSESICNQNS